MTRTRRLWCPTVALILMATLVGCTGGTTSTAASFAGHWHSPQWGDHYIVVDGNTVKIIYEHLDGRVVGTVDGSTLTGWWTEAPSRQPPAQAGEVEFTVTGTGDTRAIHGTWHHGTDSATRDDWDLVWVDTQIPADIGTEFDDAALFVGPPHP
jgi:hypothetical protein